MGGGWIAAAWFLSMLPLVVGQLSGGLLTIEDASYLGLSLLPWMALVGMPRAGAVPAEGAGDAEKREVPWFGVVALALPPLSVGAGLDVVAGAAHGAVFRQGGMGLALLAGLVLGADLARARPGGRGVHAALWLLLVPAGAALLAVLGWIAAPGEGAVFAPLVELGRWDPLVWVHAGSGSAGEAAPFLRPALAVLVLAVLPSLVARIRTGERA